MDDDSISPLGGPQKKVVFRSKNLSMDLRYVIEHSLERQPPDHARKPIKECQMGFDELDLRQKGHLGLSAVANFNLHEGNVVTFILRDLPQPSSKGNPLKDNALLKEATSKDEEQEGMLRFSVVTVPLCAYTLTPRSHYRSRSPWSIRPTTQQRSSFDYGKFRAVRGVTLRS